MGVFRHRCGLIGHTDKVCPELFELEYDDGVRNWGAYLKLVSQKIGMAATNRWLQDPIPSTVSHQNHVAGGSSFVRNLTIEGTRGVQNRTNPIEKPQTKPIQTETTKNRTWFR